MKGEKITAYGVWAAVILFTVAMMSAVEFFRRPGALKILSAAAIGAEYLGDSGVTFQTNNTNCGAAAIKMVFDHHGVVTPLKEIEADTCFTKKGASMLGLKKIAEKNNLKCEGWKLAFESFRIRRFPAILFVNDNHFVVADSVCHDEIFIRDPAVGRIRIPRKNLLKMWKGEALIFPGENGAPAGSFAAVKNIHP